MSKGVRFNDNDKQNRQLFKCESYSFSGIAVIIFDVSLDLVIILSHKRIVKVALILPGVREGELSL